jgi:hypothetical protein
MPMPSVLRRCLALVLLGSLGMACACRAEPSAAPVESVEVRLRRELDRLDGVLKQLDTASQGGLGKAAGDLRGQLAGARQASSPSVLVYQLRAPYVGVEQLAFTWEHREAGKDLGRLEALWKERGPRFQGAPGPVPAAPLLAALAQRAANRAEKHYRAALPYGRADSPASGLYYLGEAEAQRSFGDFVSTLDLPVGKPPEGEAALDPGALQAALEGLEDEIEKSFAADPATQGLNGLSARLKEARELFERGSREGAALALLECRMEVNRLDRQRGAGTAAAEPALAQAAEGSLLAPFRAVPASTDIVPFYRSLFRSRPLAAAAAKTVTVTLIRWPYT